MSRRREEDATVGEDAFLDTTANLVGILIILVVVIGTKTKIDAVEHAKKATEVDLAPLLEEPTREALALRDSLNKIALDQVRYETENVYRKAERDALLAQVQMARTAVEEQLSELDADKRSKLEKTQLLDRLQDELKEVTDQLGAIDETKRTPVILEHLPTPMARTVFNREMHIQLKGGAATVIPWDRLVETLKQQIPLAARRQASKAVLEDTLGPVGGFLMRYRMVSVPGGLELDRFELETGEGAPTEPLNVALSTSGRLRLELASRSPSETVVTVWVYPDSFNEFRLLKAQLFAEGFLCAARPLPEGVRIGASPSGSRSSAQ